MEFKRKELLESLKSYCNSIHKESMQDGLEYYLSFVLITI